MRLIDAEEKLLSLKQPIILTNDASACLNISTAMASNLLNRLVKAGRFINLMRGRWATTPNIDPLILPEYLTSPFPAYISLQSALFYHGIISQIPANIYAVSLGRTKQFKTPIATVSIHHLSPDFFFGFETHYQIKIASPEKALIDTFYLTPARSKLFKTLPEIELPDSFSIKKAESIIKKIPSPRLKTLVEKRWDKLLQSLGAN